MRAVHWGATGAASLIVMGGLLAMPASAAPLDRDLSVEIVVPTAATVAGTSTEYTVRAQNIGNDNVADASLTVKLPSNFAFDSITAQPAGPWTCVAPAQGSTGNITCTRANFPSNNNNDEITLKFKAIPGASGAAAIRAIVNGTDDQNLANNRARLDIAVQSPPGPPPGDKWGDPGYPPGWNYGGLYGYGYYGDYDDDCPYYYDCY